MGRSALALALAAVVSCTSASPQPAPPTTPSPGQLGSPGASAPVTGQAPRAQGIDAAIQDVSQNWIFPNFNQPFSFQNRDLAPVASKITMQLTPQGQLTVRGAAGAIPQPALGARLDFVDVESLDTGTGGCAKAAPDGSFNVSLQSGPGANVLITTRLGTECKGSAPRNTAGAILRVPDGTTPGPTLPFRLTAFNGKWHWSANGELLGPNASLEVQAPDFPAGQCAVPRLRVYRLFDAQGNYVSQPNVNVSGPVLTPTGLPLETDKGSDHYWALAKPQPAGQCARGTTRYDLTGWTNGLEPGWYQARLVWFFLSPNGSESEAGSAEDMFFQDERGVENNTGISYLPLANVGNAQPANVPATLFNDTASWGSGGVRGVVAKEDEGRFGLGSRVVFPAPFIASPRDPLSGRKLRYLLEPFFPSIAYSAFDYVSPQPTLTLDAAPPGKLSVSLTTPDGKSSELAKDAPITQAFISGTGALAYQVETSFSGPGRTLGVTTGLPGLAVEFTQYGQHTVVLSGTLRTVWGQDLRIRGTYEVTVAEPLDLSLGTFLGTPLEVGAELSPVVQIHPGVPADVQMSVDFYPNGDATKKQTFQSAGKANRSGYFVAKETWKPPSHGEYLARVTATWTDPADGVLWMGIRTGASIVATPNTPLIAHGQRNSNIANEITRDGQLRTWFFTRTFDPKCGEAACDPIGLHGARTVGFYPFFRGDVAWLPDLSPIGPAITLEDPQGVLARLAPDVASADTSYCDPRCPAPDSRKLNSHTSAGSGASGRPNAVDSWAYWYTSSMHADGVNIRHIASEFHATHNHWYGHEAYGCQIGLACYGAWTDNSTGEDRNGDEEGDVKLFFGGAVIKSAAGQQFVPYASMGVITPEALRTSPPNVNPPTYRFRDPKGNRVCPPFQGAASGLATCGPLLTIQGLDYDLFVTPTGTRPGAVLEPGDTFVFSAQAWPTLDIAYAVTVTSPSGKEQTFSGRASSIGYIDSAGKSFAASEPGVYTVRVSATQDKPLPSTGIAPNPPIVADGKTAVKGYSAPLSAILGSKDSIYRFVVAAPKPDVAVATDVTLGQANPQQGKRARTPTAIALSFAPPAGATDLRLLVGKPGLVLSDAPASGAQVRLELNGDKLYADGFTNIVLGASSLDITLVGKVGSDWFARTVNLRGVTPLGAAKAVLK